VGLGVLFHFEEGVAEDQNEGGGFGLHGGLDAEFCGCVCSIRSTAMDGRPASQ
jgi:hypothetical protein